MVWLTRPSKLASSAAICMKKQKSFNDEKALEMVYDLIEWVWIRSSFNTQDSIKLVENLDCIAVAIEQSMKRKSTKGDK